MGPSYDIWGDAISPMIYPKGKVPPAAGTFTSRFPSTKEIKDEIKRLRKSPYPIDKKKLAFYEKELKNSK